MAAQEPQFATVSFVLEGEISGSTFRVPIANETTVRQLAKQAMQRLVHSRRLSRHQRAPCIAVTEVYVGGGSSLVAELFSQDIVNQVVLVREETIYMKLQTRNASVDNGSLKNMAAPDPVAGEALPQQPEADSSAVPASVIALGTKGNSPIPASATASQQSAHDEGRTAPAATPALKASRVDQVGGTMETGTDSMIAELQEKELSRLGWGRQADKYFAPNYVSSPDKLMRRRLMNKKAKKNSTSAEGKNDDQCCETSKPEELVSGLAEQSAEGSHGPHDVGDADDVVIVTEQLSGGLSKEPRHDAPTRSLDINCTEYDHPTAKRQCVEVVPQSNNTSGDIVKTDVDVTLALKEGKAGKHPSKPQAATAVARQLRFEEGAPSATTSPAMRPTSGHKVALVANPEAEPHQVLPKGWGKDAMKFFDPHTYCDDPSKAKLSPTKRTVGIRARRSTTLPMYLL